MFVSGSRILLLSPVYISRTRAFVYRDFSANHNDSERDDDSRSRMSQRPRGRSISPRVKSGGKWQKVAESRRWLERQAVGRARGFDLPFEILI